MIKLKLFTTTILLFVILTPTNFTNAQSDWNYNSALYGWFAGMTGDVGIANQQEQFDVTLSELLKNLTFTAGVHFEAQNPKIVLIFDGFYFGVKKDADEITLRNGSTYTPDADVTFDEWLIEGSAGYRITPEFDVLVATRVFGLNTDLESNNTTLASANKTWVAVYAGGRYSKDFSEKWYGSIRADAGYGADGFVYFANAAVGYRFSKLFSIALAYRILNMDYESGSGVDYFLYEATASGFGLGFVFSF
jgi:hypothetical protein